MSRAALLAKLASLLLLAATLPACDRSATAPGRAPILAPKLAAQALGRGWELEAPYHRGNQHQGAIGGGGGRLQLDDVSAVGVRFLLEVPPGAVKHLAQFEIVVLPGTTYQVSLRAASGGQEISQFKHPIRLTVSYATARRLASLPGLTIACVHPDGTFEPVPTRVDPGQKTLTGYLPHFSKWTIIAW